MANNSLKNGWYGQLKVLNTAYIKDGRRFYSCQCSCGNIVIRRSDKLRNGARCDDCVRKSRSKKMLTHGETKSELYGRWRAIKRRCYLSSDPSFPLYGERGIKMYDDWKENYLSFKDYVSQLPHYGEKGYTLDRIDPDKGYEPNNIRWATACEQANNRRNNQVLTIGNEHHTLAEWSRKKNININTIHWRKRAGWTDEEVLLTPIGTPKGKVQI